MFQRQTPRGTVATHERLSFERSGLRTFAHVHPGFAHVHPGFAHVRRMFADVCTRPPRVCTLPAREAWFVHTPSKGSLVRAHCQQGKLGSCTLPAREAWFVHTPSKGSLVRAIELPRWHRAPPVAGGIELPRWPSIVERSQPSSSITKCCCWIPRWPVSYFRFPTSGFLLPVSYFRFPTSRTHCERISERIANA